MIDDSHPVLLLTDPNDGIIKIILCIDGGLLHIKYITLFLIMSLNSYSDLTLTDLI